MEERLDKLENRLQANEERMSKIEADQAGTAERLKSIDEKLDRLIDIDTKFENRFQEREACKMVRENVKDDVNRLGEKSRENKTAIDEHLKYHWGKSDKIVSYIILVILCGTLAGRLLKVF